MKKAKIMLLTIAVFATVGAALAFKVKTVGGNKYCWLETTTQPAAGQCINGSINVQVNPLGSSRYYYTTTTDHTKCNQAPNLECPNETPGFRF